MLRHVGRYEIIEELGRGDMGVVYKANDPLIDRLIAIKVIKLDGLTKDARQEYEARFYQEAKAAGRLNHPNIVTIHDVGGDGDSAYIAMEFLQGQELQGIIKSGHLTLDEILDIAIQVASGLAFAGRNGVVHRDIKPSNLVLMADHRIKIVDFGIARISASLSRTQPGMIMGSPLYMSPEQVLNRSIDGRSDIFSLGIVLYRMLSGEFPFFGDNANSVMYQIVNETPPRLSSVQAGIPDMLDPVISRCLEKIPDDRYQNADDLANELHACRSKLQQARDSVARLKNFSKGSRTIHQLVYASRPVEAITTGVLIDILTKSQFKNLRLDISGLLVFKGGKFMQLLEGEKSKVADLFATIQHDPRHTDVSILLDTDSSSRCMPSWVMGFGSTNGEWNKISNSEFYISPEVTRQICESMQQDIGNIFLDFISA